jgi:hypothetical protein
MLEIFLMEFLRPVSKGVVISTAVYTILWGAWVANPFWTVFTQASLYSGLEQIAPEWFWGWLAIVTGVLAMYTAVHPRIRMKPYTCVALLGWHWLLVSILYFYGDWHNTGGITSAFIAILCAYIYLNVKQNGGYK